MSRRPIDTRFLPPVKGINLEQSLNYFGMAAAPDPLDGFKDIGFHNHFVR